MHAGFSEVGEDVLNPLQQKVHKIVQTLLEHCHIYANIEELQEKQFPIDAKIFQREVDKVNYNLNTTLHAYIHHDVSRSFRYQFTRLFS